MTADRLRYRELATPWGPMAVAARRGKLVGALLPASTRRQLARQLKARWPDAREDPVLLPLLARQVADYCAGRAARFTVAVDLSACTPFQRRVLAACRRVPAGRVVTYGEVARRVGRPGAARAVGRTLAANPVPLVIGCHRVVAAGGRLGGFSAAGGIKLKQLLLAHERQAFAGQASGGL